GNVGDKEQQHQSVIVEKLNGYLENLVNHPRASVKYNWQQEFDKILEDYMGTAPQSFTFEGKKFAPKEFADYLKINPDDYVAFSSFTNVPYYKAFVLSIPDNFSNGSFYNLPLDEYMQLMNDAQIGRAHV